MSEAEPEGIGATAQLAISITGLTDELRAERDRKVLLAQDVSYVQTPAIVLGSVPGAPPAWGPKSGYVWAVQRVTVSGYGATSDVVVAYRGKSANDAQPQNALYSFIPAAAGATVTWHPGRTGLILLGNEGLAFGGTFTGSALVASVDVIQLQMDKLPYFLL